MFVSQCLEKDGKKCGDSQKAKNSLLSNSFIQFRLDIGTLMHNKWPWQIFGDGEIVITGDLPIWYSKELRSSFAAFSLFFSTKQSSSFTARQRDINWMTDLWFSPTYRRPEWNCVCRRIGEIWNVLAAAFWRTRGHETQNCREIRNELSVKKRLHVNFLFNSPPSAEFLFHTFIEERSLSCHRILSSQTVGRFCFRVFAVFH